jgi:hypothetical protein
LHRDAESAPDYEARLDEAFQADTKHLSKTVAMSEASTPIQGLPRASKGPLKQTPSKIKEPHSPQHSQRSEHVEQQGVSVHEK